MNRVYRALADPTRRRVLALLREQDMTAGELAAKFDLAWPTMPGHFAVLREADLIQADKVGTTIHYRLNVSVLEEALPALMDGLGVNPRRTERTASGETIRTDDPSMAKLTNLGNARPIP